MKKFLILLVMLAGALTLRAQDADSLKFDQVHLGALLQANYAGEAMYSQNPPCPPTPAPGWRSAASWTICSRAGC